MECRHTPGLVSKRQNALRAWGRRAPCAHGRRAPSRRRSAGSPTTAPATVPSTTGVLPQVLRRCLVVLLVVGLGIVAGCGSADTSPQAASTGAGTPNPQQPADVVREFLEAIRRGDDAKASQMLTEVARQETQKHELVVAPPGSETAQFEVGDTEFVVKDELAHVSSKWTDIGEDGQPHTDEIVWALRRDAAGWRIAGMATRIFPDEPPLLLDFEKPDDMIRQQRMAEEEIQRRARAAEGQATKAAKPSDGNVLRQ
jgi:hypothetical protein